MNEALEQWADSASALSVQWERDHDRFVLDQAMRLVQEEFPAKHWQAFQACTMGGRAAGEVAQELGLTTNAIYVAKCRILQRLRQKLAGITKI